jgi:DNA (cytosine-5)-methyltransferase 1
MKEIRRVPLNDYTVASTFSGCGGSCLGFRWAGFRHVYANEFVPAARETYAANFPGVFVDDRDIRKVTAEEILKRARLKVGQLDVLEGSPPCASFSTAGKRAGGWGKVKKYSDTTQRTDDLFFEFVRLLHGLKPRTFVAENVSGLVKGVAKGYFLEIMAALRAEGYVVACRVLDAQWLGVPQQRQRTIFVGVREDLGVAPAHPTPLPYRYSIRDALPWVGGFEHDTSGAFSKGKVDVDTEPVPAITVGVGGLNSLHYKVTEVVRLNANAAARRKKGTFSGKLSWGGDHPAPTIGDQGWSGTVAHEIEVVAPPPPVGFDPGTEERRRRRGARGQLRADKPALAIMADGIGGAAAHQAEVRAPLPPRIFHEKGYRKGKDAADFDSPSPTVMAHGIADNKYSSVMIQGVPPESIERFAIGDEWKKIRPGHASKKFFNLKRAHPDKPVLSITQTGGIMGAASVTHPFEPRKFTIGELRRLGGFPDDFVLTGTYRQRWERIGRAVPPPMMFRVAEVLRDQVLDKMRRR